MPQRRPLRIFAYCPWAGKVQDAAEYIAGLPKLDISSMTSKPGDPHLAKLGRLDADWHGESVRCFAVLSHPELQFLPARVLGRPGFAELVGMQPPADEEWWVIFYGQHPQALDKLAGPVMSALRRRGVRILYYAFDEATRVMPCFGEIAPSLSVLVHDDFPIHAPMLPLLRPECLTVHRSWVANLLPFAAPFKEEPLESIVFLGSEMGLTDNRRRQIAFLKERFKDRFTAHHDHSVPVQERLLLNRHKVSLCPEGRKFDTPAMASTHTDRPFWSGCLGMVPVSENSLQDSRLDGLATGGFIMRYAHGDLRSLAEACERALAMPVEERRRIYNYFNERETVGIVVADLMVRAG